MFGIGTCYTTLAALKGVGIATRLCSSTEVVVGTSYQSRYLQCLRHMHGLRRVPLCSGLSWDADSCDACGNLAIMTYIVSWSEFICSRVFIISIFSFVSLPAIVGIFPQLCSVGGSAWRRLLFRCDGSLTSRLLLSNLMRFQCHDFSSSKHDQWFFRLWMSIPWGWLKGDNLFHF